MCLCACSVTAVVVRKMLFITCFSQFPENVLKYVLRFLYASWLTLFELGMGMRDSGLVVCFILQKLKGFLVTFSFEFLFKGNQNFLKTYMDVSVVFHFDNMH